ncbi:MAG TPA: efflux RND transporter periplasmic adaptor subunit [Thermoanaerobaculaceae bacterium]|nr:efflux RND transporter periplasmic adaptor subunit [Thermoanaerobaculaceae bacterium]
MQSSRSLHWMAVPAALVVVLVLLITGCGGGAQTSAPPARKVLFYRNPMNPKVTSPVPAKDEMGMDYVPVYADEAALQSRTESRKVLFYRNPMNPKVTSPVPAKDEMGMDYVPVYADEAALQSRTESRKVLFYRNPMNPKVTSPVPAKDEMGMDYVPVYAAEGAPEGQGVPGLAAIEVAPEGLRLAGVQVESAVRERLARTIRTVGTVVPDETRIRHFHTRVTGWVEKLYVDFTGQYVRKGQPVLSLYSPQLLASQEEYLQARATAARFAVSDIPEVRKGGEELVQAARRRLQLLDVPDDLIAEIERTGQPRRDITLLAHASGYVTAKGIYEGQQVDPSMMDLFTITDLSTVWVEGQFYEYEARAVHLGDEAVVTLPYDPGTRLAGRVSYIDPTLDPQSRTLRVRFAFANPSLMLKPGMFANVELAVDGHEGVVIPASAVIDTGLRKIVFVSLGGGRFAPRQVTLGVLGNGKAEVLSGVAAGEQVVVRANFLLDSESQLRAAIAGVGGTAGGPR